MFNLLSLSTILISICAVKTVQSCICTQPLNPQFLCVDDECENQNIQENLVHHYCNSNFVIKIMITSDKLYSAIPGSFQTRLGYKYNLIHTYKIDKDLEPALDSNIIWTSQDTCGVVFKKLKLYIISGSVDKERLTLRTSSCDYIKPVKDLKVNDIQFFGHNHKYINCSKGELKATTLGPEIVVTTTAPIDTQTNGDKEKKEDLNKSVQDKITIRPVLKDSSCYCGPGSAMSKSWPSAINIGLGAANNNGEEGWNNIKGGLNIAIASGNGNTGNGLNSVNPSGVICYGPEGAGNGNGGINVGLGSGNYNGGHGWNIGNGGNNVESGGNNLMGGKGGHNVGSDSGNGNGGTNIGIISGNNNRESGWNVGNGGNNAADNTFNSEVYAEPNQRGSDAKGQPSRLGHGGNNVGDNSGNGNGGRNWGLWSGNGNQFHGWNTGNGGNNAGDNVGNGVVMLPDDELSKDLIDHNSGVGGNNRGNNTGNGKGGSLNGYGSGQNNGISAWNSGNGGNNVGDNSGNGVVVNQYPGKHRPMSGIAAHKPWKWPTGVGNGGNNVGTNSGNGFGSNPDKELQSNIKFNELLNGLVSGKENKYFNDNNKTTVASKELDSTHIKTLIDEIEAENQDSVDDNELIDDSVESFEDIDSENETQ